jgi:hypothetical protein
VRLTECLSHFYNPRTLSTFPFYHADNYDRYIANSRG